MDDHSQTPWWRTRSGIVLICFLAIGAFFLVTEHTAHVLGALPWLLFAVCPLMHLFMHHGHGAHDHHPDDAHQQAPNRLPKGGRDDAR